jgi:hypothetical protein
LRLAFAELTFEVIDLVSDGHGTDITRHTRKATHDDREWP